MRYKNPVLPGFYPDPSVCRVGRDFYLVTSSFEYFPGVPIFHSRDLVHWQQIGHCLDRPEQLPLTGVNASTGIYAPTLRYNNGMFYLTTTNVSYGGNFIVTAQKPEGPWSEPVIVNQEGIDPSLFFDKDGTVFFTTSCGGALQSIIDVKTGELLSRPKVVWTGTGGKYPEGPHLYYKDGWYYMLMAEGGTEYGHMVTIARAGSPWGPFESCSRNPVLSHRSINSPIQAVGHADLTEIDGTWFAVFLGVRPNGYPPCHHIGRETFLSPVTWADDGFPVIGNNGRVSLEMETSLPMDTETDVMPRDDFDSEKFALCWNFLRNPDSSLYSLKERPGFLRLYGSADGLDDAASPAWVGRRQCHFVLRAACCLEFNPASDNEEAGLVVRMNERHHYEMFLSMRNGRPCVILRRRIGSLHSETACHPLPLKDIKRITLVIDADRDKYTFSYGCSENMEDDLHKLGEGETRYLSTEVAGGFTGVYMAMYASGNGSKCSHPADFDWFDYYIQDDDLM
ncbi:MAG: glycoside hydrolase family 43 protein [Candidatus Goldbacteria bacterium]|nr:glycoside hydrolase family 43 protein [Candidatus Goldiibacteriota bacterium]